MTNEEIRTLYREAKDKKRQVGILADLTQKTKDEIREIVADLIHTPVMPLPSAEVEYIENPPAMNPRQARVGKNGTLTIPKVVRVAAGIFGGTVVDVMLSGETVTIRPHNNRCYICGGTEGIEVMQGVGICQPCAKKLLGRMRSHEECKS